MPVSPETRIFAAIGDVHGHCERLKSLHEAIFELTTREFPGRALTLVHLGDYVDRGPDSAGVIETLIGLEREAARRDDLHTVALMGNHERMMIDGFEQGGDALEHWLINGGFAARDSYAPYEEEDLVAHLDWMKGLPLIHEETEAGLLFVHAGVHPAEYPEENEQVYLWTRSARFFDTSWWTAPGLAGMRVIHGHTPTTTQEPDISPDQRRINIDTGACFGGPLTAIVLAPDGPPRFVYA